MHLFKQIKWLLKFKQWILYSFITIIIFMIIAVFGIITSASENIKENSRRVFESAIWNSLQLQVQAYRFQNYITSLSEDDFPLKGNAYLEYDLLMSRVDLLRESDVGFVIRQFEDGKTTRLLNIINGELELLSLDLSKIESNEIAYLPGFITRLQRLEKQINEFISLVNKGSIDYLTNKHKDLQRDLYYIQLLSVVLLLFLSILCFITVKGLSELKSIVGSNKNLRSTLQKTREDKANMVSFIGHEIRSPINAILGITKTLNNTESVGSAKALSKHIEESGYQLLHTVEMLSNLSLLDANKLPLIHSTDHLQNKIESYLRTLEAQMARKGIQSVVYIDPALPTYATLDFTRVKEIVVTLLQNAITHTASGSISVQIRPSTLAIPLTALPMVGQESRMLQIAVKDTGLGMPSRLQENLRKHATLFYKENEQMLDKVGLNLALCYKLVHLMQGEIVFSCDSKNGCEFWIDIPFYVPTNKVLIESGASLDNLKRHALFIEEDAYLANVVQQQLATFNIDVTHIKEDNFQENGQYDLVILGNTAWFEHNGYDVIHQWHQKSCPVFCYHPILLSDPDISVIPLHFPLLQSQLQRVLSDQLLPKKINKGETI